MTIRISIALATYNGEKYLVEQLRSFCNQTRMPDELIICDDCSQDSTLSIAYDFAAKAPFTVKIIVNQRNLGYVQNFSNAFSYCNGDIVFISDQDDVWLPTKIEKMSQYLDLNPHIQLVIHDLDYCKEDLRPIGQTKIQRMENNFDLNWYYVVGMATAIRNPFLKLCMPVPNSGLITHDMWLHHCSHSINRKAIITDVLALYRRHQSNVTIEGKLNVDFVTTASYFKTTLYKKIKNVNNLKIILKELLDQSLIQWLVDKRDLLIENNYVSSVELEIVIEHYKNYFDSIKQRCLILSLKRRQRFFPIIYHYRKGGYDYFDGLRTAFGDFLPK
ncbi:glycosyltransferase family 2 protein [Methylicorpusculum oleiharenae]|uniref:glycosyltransferase family 2 protein n=1 Tax=Methylicorpusculum oleiharenae TaxID=1338687 RepID=UPI0013599D2A|nr:glycosyltransferase family 2 protein [Methylicorpusculum oleiharenae]MCD2452741.1 glycosyltransferase family 2 protein [Methylicorpusculum oleiharenae]